MRVPRVENAQQALDALERAKPLLNIVEAYDSGTEGWVLYHAVLEYLRRVVARPPPAQSGGEEQTTV